jgi:hypothetical protein
MEKKIRVSLTEKELGRLEHIIYHFTDYMAYDDRPDHGFGILKGYRELPQEEKNLIYYMAGRLRRTYRKHREKNG